MMSTYSQLLARKYHGRLDAHAEQIMGYIVEGASRMESLVTGLLAYSSVTAPDESGRSGRVEMNRAAGVAILNLAAVILPTLSMTICLLSAETRPRLYRYCRTS